MKPASNASERRRSLVAYFVLTYLISWAIEIPLALSYQHIIANHPPFALHYLASFGPLAAAVIVTLATEGCAGVRRLFSGLAPRRVITPSSPLTKASSLTRRGEASSLARSGEASSLARSGERGRGDSHVYFLFAVVSPLVLFALVVAASGIVQGAWPDLRSLGQPDYLPYIGILPTLGLWLLTFGLGEEVGWRGFALPRLQAERPALSASLLLGALWAGWHLPALFYRDTYIAMGLLVIPMLLTVAAVGSVVYTWLYNGTGGNLLLLVLFHGLFDFFSVWPAGVIGAGPVMTIVMVFWAVRVFKLYGPATLCPTEKVVI
jgi:membrane protease YdiL (CAAX protease family)